MDSTPSGSGSGRGSGEVPHALSEQSLLRRRVRSHAEGAAGLSDASFTVFVSDAWQRRRTVRTSNLVTEGQLGRGQSVEIVRIKAESSAELIGLDLSVADAEKLAMPAFVRGGRSPVERSEAEIQWLRDRCRSPRHPGPASAVALRSHATQTVRDAPGDSGPGIRPAGAGVSGEKLFLLTRTRDEWVIELSYSESPSDGSSRSVDDGRMSMWVHPVQLTVFEATAHHEGGQAGATGDGCAKSWGEVCQAIVGRTLEELNEPAWELDAPPPCLERLQVLLGGAMDLQWLIAQRLSGR